MTILDGKKVVIFTWLAPLAALTILLAACGGGVSDEEFAAVQFDLQAQQAQVQQLEAEVAGLNQRLTQGAATVQVMDAFFGGLQEASGAGGPSADDLRKLTALVQATGDPALQSKWVEIVDSVVQQAGPPPPSAVSGLTSAVEASGNQQVAAKLQEFFGALQGGNGGAEFLELNELVHASGDPALQAVIGENVAAVVQAGGSPPDELQEEFEELAKALGLQEVQQAFFGLGGPPPEFFEEIGAKVKAVGDPSLEALVEELASATGGDAIDAFIDGLLAAMNRTLGGVDAEVQSYFDAVAPIFAESDALLKALNNEGPGIGPESDVGEAKQWFDRIIAIQEQGLNRLQGIQDIPEGVREAHDEYIATGTALLELNRRISDELGRAGPDFDIAQLASDPELGIAPQGRLSDQSTAACNQLERIARSNGVTADLRCGGS